jgi:hypothetical protein
MKINATPLALAACTRIHDLGYISTGINPRTVLSVADCVAWMFRSDLDQRINLNPAAHHVNGSSRAPQCAFANVGE